MKHIQVYESFNTINEGVTLNDIIKLADRELIEGMFPGKKFKKSGQTTYFAEEVNKSKLDSSILRASAIFNAKDSNGGNCYGEIMTNSTIWTKIVTPQQQAADKNIYDVNSKVDELIGDVKGVWNAILNKENKTEVWDWLEKNGWKMKR